MRTHPDSVLAGAIGAALWGAFRARKLAELDQQYSNGELSVEEYMSRRSEIMNG